MVPLRRNHDFLVLWTGETVSALGTSMSFFVFPLIGYALTGSTTQAALAGAAFAAGRVLFQLPAGALVDRWPRRPVLFWANLLGALLYAGLGLAVWRDVLQIGELVVVGFLTGAVAVFFGPAETAAIKAVVPREQLPTAFSQNQAREHVASLVGPPVGGALFSAARAMPFVVDAVTYLVSALAVTRIRHPLEAPQREAEAVSSMFHDIGEGIRFLWSRGFLRAIVMFASLANFAGLAFFLVLTLKLLQAGVHPAAIGLVETIAAAAGLAGSFAAPWLIRRVPTGFLTILLALLIALGISPMAFTDSVPVIGVLLALVVFVNPAGNAAVTSYPVATVPDHLQGRTQSALGFLCSAPSPLGPLVGGAVLAAFGPRDAMLVVAALVALAVVPLVLSRDVRTLPTPDRWPGVEQVEPAGILEP